MNPGAKPLFEQAQQLFDTKAYEEALALFHTALEKDPNAVEILTRIADSHFRLKNYEASQPYCQEALEANPAYAPAHYRWEAFKKKMESSHKPSTHTIPPPNSILKTQTPGTERELSISSFNNMIKPWRHTTKP